MAWSSNRLACLLLLAAASVALAMAPRSSQASPDDFLDPHNAARTLDPDLGPYNVVPVTWNGTVAVYAESYAAERQGDCMVQPSGSESYGENMFWSSEESSTAADAVATWVSEKQWYHHDSNACLPPDGASCGHYTQVVWNASTDIGCASVVCDGGAGVFITCNYWPPGNIPSQSPY